VRYRFIQQYKEQFPIRFLCQAMQVSTSGYYAWSGRAESSRSRRNRLLLVHIKAAHKRSRKTYGRRRIHAQLQREGCSCSQGRVARLMRQAGLQGKRKRGFRATTDSQHALPVAPNLLAQDFTATAPNQVWVSDITYLSCGEGWEYLATIMDLFNRQIVGWASQATLEHSLTVRALQMALGQQHPAPGLIHHSDRGVQYACRDYQALLAQHGITCSMSRKGNPLDNAPQESFFASFKTELVQDWSRLPRAQVRQEVFDYIEIFYNRQRLHSTLGYQTPVEFAANYAK
jgi:putative transposase